MEQRRRVGRGGFSLVEMMIIIGMLGILAGGIGLSFVLLRSADTKGAAYDINGALGTLKTKTTGGKDQWYLYLYSLDDRYYMDTTRTEPDDYSPAPDGIEIADSRMQISYGAAKEALEDAPGGFLCIGFRKKDGAFLASGGCACPGEIYVEEKDADGYIIHMVEDTGHHYIEER